MKSAFSYGIKGARFPTIRPLTEQGITCWNNGIPGRPDRFPQAFQGQLVVRMLAENRKIQPGGYQVELRQLLGEARMMR